jgi:hypothetical protein
VVLMSLSCSRWEQGTLREVVAKRRQLSLLSHRVWHTPQHPLEQADVDLLRFVVAAVRGRTLVENPVRF